MDQSLSGLTSFIILAALWELVWKGWALWLAARNDDRAWYVVLLIINSLGILPLIYILVLDPKKNKSKKSSK